MLKKCGFFLAVIVLLFFVIMPVMAEENTAEINTRSKLSVKISDTKLEVTPSTREVSLVLENRSRKLIIGSITNRGGDDWITPSWYLGGYHGISGKKKERINFNINWDVFSDGETKIAIFDLELKTIDFSGAERHEVIMITATKTKENGNPNQLYTMGIEKKDENSATIWFQPKGVMSRFAVAHYKINSERRQNRFMRYQKETQRWEYEVRNLDEGDIINYYIGYEKRWSYHKTEWAQYVHTLGPVLAPLLTSAIAEDSAVNLSWESVKDADGYQLLYGTGSGDYTEAIAVGKTTSYLVTGLLNNTPYYFAVKAIRGSQESELSNEKSATPIPAKLSVISGANTDILHPVGYLIDGDLSTSWGFKPGSEEGWAELDLGKDTLISGLEISGTLYPETILSLEYAKDGLWLPFLAPLIRELGTKEIIDLSYDSIVSSKLRIRLRGDGVQNSSIAEISIIGEGVTDFDQKIKPEKVVASENTAPTAPAKFLVDENTYTLWQTKPTFWSRSQLQGLDELYTEIGQSETASQRKDAGTAGHVIFEFANSYRLNNINLFFTEKVKGNFSLEIENNGNWQHLESISDIEKGWYRLDLSDRKVTTTKVRLLVMGSNGELGGVSEVQFFGRGQFTGKKYKFAGVEEAIHLTKPYHCYLQLVEEDLQDYYLELVVTEETDESLEIELNGKLLSLQPSFILRGHTVYRHFIDVLDFQEGCNFLMISENPALTLVNARLNPEIAGDIHNYPGLTDGLLLTPVVSESRIELDLNQKTLIEEVAVYSDNDYPYFDLYAFVDGSWLPLNQKASDNKCAKYIGNLSTLKIRIDNPGSFNLSEVKIKGSASKDQAPEVEILSPIDGEVIGYFGMGIKYIYGFIDNQEAQVYVNGKKAYQNGHYFWIRLMKAGLRPWQTMEITAKATDLKGRENSHSIEVMMGELPLVNLEQPDKIVYTADDTFTISGRVMIPFCKIKVNGQEISTSRWGRFKTQVDLTAGYNLIKIDCIRKIGHDREFTQTSYRRVYQRKDEAELTINTPLVSSYLKIDSVIVSGTVKGLGEVSVIVNGKPAEIDGMYYVSPVISINEESEKITVQVNDDNGTVSKEISIYRDLTSPIISQVSPEEGYLSNNSVLEVSGQIEESGQYYVYVNGKAANILDNHTFRQQISLSDGKEVAIIIKAVDQAGNVGYYTKTIMVDTTSPESFTPLAKPADWTNNVQPEITFQTSDIVSGINHYELAIDGGTYQEVTSPYQLPTLIDGIHEITVKVIDNAGWETMATTKVYIDTTVPHAFIPLANPAGWTSSRPEISFLTTDDGAGIDHYELSIDDGEYITVESPYVLPELADGSHLIKVKAVDKLGYQTIGDCEVYVDTTVPVITLNAEYDGLYTSDGNFEITGKVEDLTDVSFTVQGLDVVVNEDTTFSTALNLQEGANSIVVKATDQAGLVTSQTFTIYLDTTAPNEFVPIADPGDWTNNVQPVITFETTDDLSGIDHFELKVNDGEYVTVESPYQLPEQEDGMHLISIKAVDEMGFETICTTKIFIDTLAPEVPGNLRVIPGTQKMIVKWDLISSDVIEYRLVKKNQDQLEYFTVTETEFTDLDLENGEQYAYQVLAIDRAYNESLLTVWQEGTVGLTEVPYEPDEGAILEYEDVTLTMTQEGLADDVEKVTISEVKSEELEDKAIYPMVGPMYEFSAYKKGSDTPEENMVAEQGYIGCISYDESQIPEGFPEQNLGVYHFDTMFGKWFLIPSAGVDVENNKIYFITNHFSSFSVQATVLQDLTPQEYKDAGYSPLKTYSQHGGITISPQFGTASTEATELVLPGRNGFDLVLSRRYDTATARNDAFALAINGSLGFNVVGSDPSKVKDYGEVFNLVKDYLKNPNWANEAKESVLRMIEEYILNQGDFAYSMGQGWRLNIPYVKAANSSMILRTEEGGMHYINEMRLVDVIGYVPFMFRRLKFEQHEGTDFTLYIEQVYSPVDVTHYMGDKEVKSRWYSSGYQLVMKDGTTYEMDALGRTTKKIDPTGLNSIEYKYRGLFLDHIIDSMGRKVCFDYEGDLLWPKIDKIWVENDVHNRQINYHVGVDDLLHSATDSEGRVSSYDYDIRLMYGGQAGFKVNILNIICKLVGGPFASLAGSIFGEEDIELFGQFKVQVVQPMDKMVAPGQGMTKIEYEQPTLMYGSCSIDWFLVIPESVTFSVNLEQYLLANKVEVYLNPNEKIRTTTYDYHLDYYDWHQPVNYRTVENDGQRETIYRYLPVAKKRYRWEDRSVDSAVNIPMQFWTYHLLSVVDDIEIKDAADHSLLEKREYQYNIEKMRPSEIVTKRGDNYRKVNYSYDNWGNVEYIKDHSLSNGREQKTESWSYYVNTDSKPNYTLPWKQSPFAQGEMNSHIHDCLAGKLIKNYTPDDNKNMTTNYLHSFNNYNSLGQLVETATWVNNIWSITRLEYYSADGSLKRKVNPLGHETLYEYDNYGLPKKVIEKDVVDAQGYYRDVVVQYGYEYISGWKMWEKNPRGYVNEFEYDALGRTTKITNPDDDDDVNWLPGGYPPSFRNNNPTTVIEYNDSSLYSIITNPLGQRTMYDFDDLGQMVKEVKYRKENYTYEEAAVTTLKYDSWGNIIAITDPNGNSAGPAWKYTTRYQYDALGRNEAIIYPDETEHLSDNPKKTMDFDYTNNTLTITDERGKITKEYYDMQERVVKQIRYNQANYVLEEIVSEIYYDGLGNEVMTIDPKGSKTLKEYNELNQLARITLPMENFYEKGRYITASPYQWYEYNSAGQKIKDVVSIPGGGEHETLYQLNGLGQITQTTTSYTDRDGLVKEAVAEVYYDLNGNQVKLVDANNTLLPEAEQKAYTYTYSALDKPLTETDLAGNITSYTYDQIGNQKSMTDPRGNSGNYDGDFTIVYHYDELNRLIKGELPKAKDDLEKPLVELSYDPRGNLVERIESNGAKTSYTYNPRNQVKTETVSGDGKNYTVSYKYDQAGNQVEIIDSLGKVTRKEYDDLNRLMQISYPEGNQEWFEYDLNGNRKGYEDGEHNYSRYNYDKYNRLMEVVDAKNGLTSYSYDQMGNLTLKVNALGQRTEYDYDQLNRLMLERNSLGYETRYGYDRAGNRIYKKDPNKTESVYEYYPNYLLKKIMMTNGAEEKVLEYTYDEAGYQITASDDGVVTRYNTFGVGYVPDPYGRVYQETSYVDGQSFDVEYRYDITGRIIGVKSPNGDWVEYEYNSLGELTRVPGYVASTEYDARGMLKGLTAHNGIYHSFQYDDNNRLTNLSYNKEEDILKKYAISYDNANNIKTLNDNSYQYDALNRLLYAELKGKFENIPEEENQEKYRTLDDFRGENTLELIEKEVEIVELDYAAGSIGVGFNETKKVTKIKLTPENIEHRVDQRHLAIYYGSDRYEFTELIEWEYLKNGDGEILILLREPIDARYIKVKTNLDDRDEKLNPENNAEFRNRVKDIIKVYYYVTERTEIYEYDAIGNRLEENISDWRSVNRNYSYYPNSNRLKSNEKYTFYYDDNGNMVRKVSAEDEWEYEYDLLDRLINVTRNGTSVAIYTYNADGLRLMKENSEKDIYYVYNQGDQIIYEQENDTNYEYIYVGGRHFARVDTNRVTDESRTYFYNTDHLGSTVLVTDEEGKIAWTAEYTPFGSISMAEGLLEKTVKFTGKDLDEDTGLYYYNARWYDQELGRFISEDPLQDGDNWYAYVSNNPMNRIDPTGLEWTFNDETWEWTATEQRDTIWDLTESIGFDSWQETAEHAGIRDWYDDAGNWIGGNSRSLMGMSIKTPLDIYTANFVGFSGTLLELSYKDTGLVLAASMSDVMVENSRTNDAFSTSLYSWITDANEIGFQLPGVGASISTLYGAFPRHYSDFIENEKHRMELYDSLTGDATMSFTNFVIGTYSQVESKYWRGESIYIGFLGPKVNLKNAEIGGIGKGEQISYAPLEQKFGFGNIKLIPGEEILVGRKEEFFRNVAVGNTVAGSNRVNPNDAWIKALQGIREDIEKKYQKLWR